MAEKARKEAADEMDKIVAAYDNYLAGRDCPYIVPSSKLSDRLDAKHLNPWSVERLSKTWNKAGARSETLENLVDRIEDVITIEATETYTFLRITYTGYATAGEKALGKEVSYSRVGKAKPGDIVVSHINAVNGATCVLPEKAKDYLVASEFTILRIKPEKEDEVDPMYLWSVLRSPAVIAEWLSSSTGLGRHRVEWELLKKQKVPLLDMPRQKEIGDLNRKEHHLNDEIMVVREDAIYHLNSLDLHAEAAKDKLARVKPPR